MMKVLSSLVVLIALAVAQTTPTTPTTPTASAACMYCRRMDLNAGFLVSYSYCEATDTCLMDAWNYINRPCTGGW